VSDHPRHLGLDERRATTEASLGYRSPGSNKDGFSVSGIDGATRHGETRGAYR
jgi:hypothetical protein